MSKTGYLSALIAVFFLTACTQKPVVKIYPQAKEARIKSLALAVYPPDPKIEKSFKALYRFDPSADTVLKIYHKEGISCNSNQNAQQKALSKFPHNFLRMELARGRVLYYSYYIDLDEKVDEEDIRRAFGRMKRDLEIR